MNNNSTLKAGKFIIGICAVLCCALFFCACKKSVADILPDDDYYIRFKVDGTQKEYKTEIFVNAEMPDGQTAGWYVAGIAGVAEDFTSSSISLSISDVEPLKIDKTYEIVYHAGSNDVPKTLATMMYMESGEGFYSATQTNEPGFSSAQLRFTEITDEYVKGTFNGVLLESPSEPAPIKYTLTSGEFFVPRKKTPPANPGSGDGYIEFTIDGRTHRIDENTSSLVQAKAEFSDYTNPVRQTCLILFADYSASPVRDFRLGIADLASLSAKEYTFNTNTDFLLKASVFPSFQYYNVADDSQSYMYVQQSPDYEITINVTRMDKNKGGKIEGTFNISSMKKVNSQEDVLADDLHLTNGKFRVTVD